MKKIVTVFLVTAVIASGVAAASGEIGFAILFVLWAIFLELSLGGKRIGR